MALIWWRAYDSGVNGVSDACYQLKGLGLEGQKEASRRGWRKHCQALKMTSKYFYCLAGTGERLAWLFSHGKLPLPSHQAHGSFYTKVSG